MVLTDIYTKTALGQEAMTQRELVADRDQRLVLVLVDGLSSVAELGAKIRDVKLVEKNLKLLETQGFVQPLSREALSAVSKTAKGIPAIKPRQGGLSSAFTSIPTLDPSQVHVSPKPKLPQAEETVMEGEKPVPRGHAPIPPTVPVTLAVPQVPGHPPEAETPALLDSKPDSKRAATASVLSDHRKNHKRWKRPDVSTYMVRMIPNILKFAAFLACVGVMLGGVWVAVLFPYEVYTADLEAELSRQLGVPVTIGSIQPRFFPVPVLELHEVVLGQNQEGKIQQIRLPDLPGFLMRTRKVEHNLGKLVGGTLPLNLFMGLDRQDSVPEQGISGGTVEGVFELEEIDLSFADQRLARVQGHITIGEKGGVDTLEARSLERDFTLTLGPVNQQLRVHPERQRSFFLTMSDRSLIERFPLKFGSFTAEGILGKDHIVFSRADMRFLGGRYEGTLAIYRTDQQPLWTLEGKGQLSRLDSAALAALWTPKLAITGPLSGSIQFKTTGETAGVFHKNLRGSGQFQLERGEFKGVSLSEVFRRSVGQSVSGGNTRFDRLNFDAVLGPAGLRISPFKLEAGALQVQGDFVVNREAELRGELEARLTQAGKQFVRIMLGGTLPKPEARNLGG